MPKITPEDRKLFRETVKNLNFVSPHHKNDIQPKTPPALPDLYDPHYQTTFPTDKLFYSRGGLQNKTLKNLNTGKIKIQAELDLHGHTVEEAREVLSQFIYASLAKKLKYIRVIHGKGNILKNHVNSWLQQIEAVLAFASAGPTQGGTGAVSVILKTLI